METQRKKKESSIRDIYRYGRSLSSCSSLSSHDSGGGGKMKKSSFSFSGRKQVMSHCSTVSMSKEHSSGASRSKAKEFLLRNNRRSLPIINKKEHRNSKRRTTQNEEWDISESATPNRHSHSSLFLTDPKLKQFFKSAKQTHSKKTHLPGKLVAHPSLGGPLRGSPASLLLSTSSDMKIPHRKIPPHNPNPKSCIKGMGKSCSIKKLQVRFAETEGLIPQDTRPLENTNIIWYSPSDLDEFLNDATIRASLTDRTMKYAAMNERSYNSSTGLTAPKDLKEYLSFPEEIIGVEHLLTVQKMGCDNLKRHHANALMKEQRRQKRDGYDQYLLAARLRNSSTISAHMARERALYITQMD